MKKYKEIFRLKEMLEEAGIPFQWVENFGYSQEQIKVLEKIAPDLIEHYHIIYPHSGDKQICSAIEGFGTYGAEQDRLELMGLLTPKERKSDCVAGGLSAEDVFNRIQKHYRKEIFIMKKIKVVDEDTLEIKEIEVKEDLPKDEKFDEFSDQLRTALNCEPEEFYKKYKKMKKAEEEFKKLYDPFKEKLIQIYTDTPDLPKGIIVGGAKLTYVSPSVRNTIDSKKLKEEEPELAKRFTKQSKVSATIRIEEV